VRLLAAVRLSRETDETTSPESQRNQITGYAQLYGHDVECWATDLDVKGSVSPFDREKLGPYLTDPKLIGTWDGIIVSKLDRLGRSVVDFGKLLEWCRANRKTVISVAESLDFGSAAGVMFANVLIAFAQFERERMAERRREAAKSIREEGKWGGGQVAFGYRPERNGNRWILVKDAHTAKIAEAMADKVIVGESLSAVSRWLNESGEPTPRKARKQKGTKQAKTYQWWPATVRDVLRSRSLLGEMAHKGQTVHGVRFDPIITEEKFAVLQAALDKTCNPLRGERRDASLLLRVVFCACGEPLFQTQSGNENRYYRCRSKSAGKPCGARMIPMRDLENEVEDLLFSRVRYVTEPRLIPGNDSGRELEKVGREMTALTEERFVRQVVKPDYHAIMARLEAEHDRLSKMEPQPDRVERVWTDKTLDAVWPEWDAAERRRYLVENGYRLRARRNDDGSIDLEPIVDAELADPWLEDGKASPERP
jgi:site-specific DNA recombinase